MSHTTRWFWKPQVQFRFCLRPEDCIYIDHDQKPDDPVISFYVPVWKQYNPRDCKHESKLVRVREHRKFRKMNKIRLKKGMEIIPEWKTSGWLTH